MSQNGEKHHKSNVLHMSCAVRSVHNSKYSISNYLYINVLYFQLTNALKDPSVIKRLIYCFSTTG